MYVASFKSSGEKAGDVLGWNFLVIDSMSFGSHKTRLGSLKKTQTLPLEGSTQHPFIQHGLLCTQTLSPFILFHLTF